MSGDSQSHFIVSKNRHGPGLSVLAGFSSLQTKTVLDVDLPLGGSIQGFVLTFQSLILFQFLFCVSLSSSQVQLIIGSTVDSVFANLPAH